MVARKGLLRAERDALAYKFGYKCASCAVLLQPGWHADHVTPLADGGANEIANMQPLCAPCHTGKTARENSARVPRVSRPVRVPEAHKFRVIALTDKCTAAFAVWRARGEPFRVERYERIAGLCMDQIVRAGIAVTKTRTAQRETPYNMTDLKHDLRSGLVVLV
jgi:hypothetical protein